MGLGTGAGEAQSGFEFGGELIEDVGDRWGLLVEEGDGDADGGSADEGGIAGDEGIEEESGGKERAEFADDVGAFALVLLDHGHEDAGNFEGGSFGAEALDGVEDLGNGAHAEGFRLLGDEDGVGGAEDIAGDPGESGRGVDEDGIEALAGAEFGGDALEGGGGIDALLDCFEEPVGVAAGENAQFREPCGEDHGFGGGTGIDGVVEAPAFAGFFREGEANRALGIGIDEQGMPASAGEGVGEVDGDGGFADASFLAGDRENSHWETSLGCACGGCMRNLLGKGSIRAGEKGSSMRS
jgi:hypothetical protein